MVGGQRSCVHYVGGVCVCVSSAAMHMFFAHHWQQLHVTCGRWVGGGGGKIDTRFPLVLVAKWGLADVKSAICRSRSEKPCDM